MFKIQHHLADAPNTLSDETIREISELFKKLIEMKADKRFTGKQV